jgi:hypothetical protein
MGMLRLLADVLNRQLYSGTQACIVPHGSSLPLDPFALGKVRFGRKLEAVLPLLVAENLFHLDVDAMYQVDRITLDRMSVWLEPGGFVYIGKRELHEIEDISDSTLILKTLLLADHLAGQVVYHYSNPVQVEGNYVQGSEYLNLDTTYFLIRGDVIAIPIIVGDSILSFQEYKIKEATLTSTLNGVNQYFVLLDGGIFRDLSDNETVQLRAFLGYQSKIVNLPVQTEALRRLVGPYLLDWVSAPFLNNIELLETQTIQRYDISRQPIGGPETIGKNHLMVENQIEANQFLFWDLVEGRINYDASLDRVLLQQASGHCRLKYNFAPSLPVPVAYASGSFVVPAPSALFNNEWFRIFDGADATRFEYKVTSAYVVTPSAAATGSITVTSVPNNNDGFVLADGFGTVQRFEFMQDASTFTLSPWAQQIDVTLSVFPVDVTAKMVEAISKSLIKLAPLRVGTSVQLTHSIISQNGNQPIVLDASLLFVGWSSTGMSGGTDRVETIDLVGKTTDNDTAILTSSVINKATLQVRSDYPGTYNSFKVFSNLPGVAGNQLITKSIVSPLFLLTGMSGGGGGLKWNFTLLPDQEVKVRIRLFPNDWLPLVTLPAAVTSSVLVELKATDQAAARIDFLISAPATSTEIQMSGWSSTSQKVAALSYDYVAQMYGDYTFGSTGLWAKPLMFSLDDVRMHLNRNNELDAAWVRL